MSALPVSGTWASQGRAATAGRPVMCCRIRQSSTFATDSASPSGPDLIARRRTAVPSSPAASASRSDRHSPVAAGSPASWLASVSRGADLGLVAVPGGFVVDVLPLNGEHVQPVGVRPLGLPGRRRRELPPVPDQALPENFFRHLGMAGGRAWVLSLPGAFVGKSVKACQLGSGLGAGARICDPPPGDDPRFVAVPAAGQRDCHCLPVFFSCEHGDAGVDGLAFGGVEGHRVRQVRVRSWSRRRVEVEPVTGRDNPEG